MKTQSETHKKHAFSMKQRDAFVIDRDRNEKTKLKVTEKENQIAVRNYVKKKNQNRKWKLTYCTYLEYIGPGI